MTTVAYGYPIPISVILQSGINNKVVKANVIDPFTMINIVSNLSLPYVAGTTGRYAYTGTAVLMPAASVFVQYLVYEPDGVTLVQEDGETFDLLQGSEPGPNPVDSYITLEQVKQRLEGKVRWTDQVLDENKMYEGLAIVLIKEAEGQVELDLSERYFAPFQTIDNQTYTNLPARPTKNILSSLCLAQAVMKILDTDFGMGGAVDSGKYYEKIEARYKAMVGQLLEKRDGIGTGWRYPPLPGLRLNYQNLTDDGFTGAVLVISGSDAGSYPANQVNDPSSDFSDLMYGSDD